MFGGMSAQEMMQQAALARMGRQMTSVGAGILSGGFKRGLGPGLAAANQASDPMRDVMGIMAMQEMQNKQRLREAMVARPTGDPLLDAMAEFGDPSKAIALARKGAEAPKTRTVKVGDNIVTQQWDPRSGTWSEVATAPRYKPDAPSVSIINQQLPKLEPGQEFVRDNAGNITAIRNIPGGKQDLAAKETERLEGKRQRQTEIRYGVAQDALATARDFAERVPTWTTGFWGDVLKNVGGTGAANMAGAITTLENFASTEALQQMRNSNPTGAAVGNVSNMEGQRLASAFGNLAQSQGAEQFKANLDTYERALNDIVYGPPEHRAAMARENSVRWPGAPMIGTVDSGYVYWGGDPKDQKNWRPQ